MFPVKLHGHLIIIYRPHLPIRGGELGVLRVREHPLSAQMRPLTAKSTLSKLKKNFVKYLVILRSNKNMVI